MTTSVIKIFVITFLAVAVEGKSIVENDSPIIGVLAQEIAYSLEKIYPGEYKSFIPASYVKFVEGGGARVVPVWIGRDKKYYENVIKSTNGLLLPGGATWFNQSCGYADAGVMLYNLARKENKEGNYYPIFGTCLGMELLIYAAAGAKEYRADCLSKNVALPLEFKSGFKKSKMFKNISDEILNVLKAENVTWNYHQYCVTNQHLKDLNISQDWRVLSVNKDINGIEFISSLENKKYPFFGIQFHPEKNLYEWKPKRNIPHTENAIKAAQYFAQMFINEARKSPNKYKNEETERNDLIYNYPMKYTGKDGSSYEQCYLFKEDKNAKCK